MRPFVLTGIRRLPVALLFSVFVCVTLSGCGRATGSVSGTVKYQGKVLPFGSVTFFSLDGLPATGSIQSDGTYTVEQVGVGLSKVVVVCHDPRMAEDLKAYSTQMRNTKPGATAPRFDTSKYLRVPEQYGDQARSGLSFDVVQGTNSYPIDLK
jgi:hypothetical protein